ncbi:MAG: response regulator [Bacteroidetes bacterium]|jgi:CheY-like chemotaxis protein|nr:response regulator [Bacteroidota bacterium]
MTDKLEALLKDKDFSSKRILVVEDDYTSFFFLEELLEQIKATLVHATDGTEACKICENEQIDLVLMDIQMPMMDGYEATRKIRKFRPSLPIIAQTANALHSDKVKSIEAGCNDYIAKPIIASELIEKITKYLQ